MHHFDPGPMEYIQKSDGQVIILVPIW